MTDSSLALRVQEIVNNSDGQISVRDALKQALRETYGSNPEILLDALATASMGIRRAIRKQLLTPPDVPDGQLALSYNLPETIVVPDDDRGDLLVPRRHATMRQVREWARAVDRHTKVMRLRAERQNKIIAREYADFPDDLLFLHARAQVIARTDGELECATG